MCLHVVCFNVFFRLERNHSLQEWFEKSINVKMCYFISISIHPVASSSVIVSHCFSIFITDPILVKIAPSIANVDGPIWTKTGFRTTDNNCPLGSSIENYILPSFFFCLHLHHQKKRGSDVSWATVHIATSLLHNIHIFHVNPSSSF